MSREIFAGKRPSLESDVYAFGGLILTVSESWSRMKRGSAGCGKGHERKGSILRPSSPSNLASRDARSATYPKAPLKTAGKRPTLATDAPLLEQGSDSTAYDTRGFTGGEPLPHFLMRDVLNHLFAIQLFGQIFQEESNPSLATGLPSIAEDAGSEGSDMDIDVSPYSLHPIELYLPFILST